MRYASQSAEAPQPVHAGQAVRALTAAPAFHALSPAIQRQLAADVEHVAGYLEHEPWPAAYGALAHDPYAVGLAGPGDLRQRMQTQSGAPAPAAPGAAPGVTAAPGTTSAPAGGTSATGRVGEVTRATLNAIGFPEFVASLIQGTFKAIVDASIQQMEAYAALLKNVASTVDRFMDDNVTEGMAKDHLTTEHPWLFKTDTRSGAPQLAVNTQADRPMPGFLKDLGFDSPAQLDKQTVNEVVIPAARKTLAETRQQTLATMVMMGINRVVVDDGEVKAKLVFHIDASETTAMRFDQQKQTTGNMAGQGGGGVFGGQALMVNTASVNAQSDLNVRADLTGEVRVKFRSDAFPLERFADSNAIQLINGNAKVPERQPAAAPAAPGQPGPAAAAPAPAAPAPAPPATVPAPAAGQQGFDDDPWLQR